MNVGNVRWAETGSRDRMRPGTPPAEKRNQVGRPHSGTLNAGGSPGPYPVSQDTASMPVTSFPITRVWIS